MRCIWCMHAAGLLSFGVAMDFVLCSEKKKKARRLRKVGGFHSGICDRFARVVVVFQGEVVAPAVGGASTTLVLHSLKRTGPKIPPCYSGTGREKNVAVLYTRPNESTFWERQALIVSVPWRFCFSKAAHILARTRGSPMSRELQAHTHTQGK